VVRCEKAQNKSWRVVGRTKPIKEKGLGQGACGAVEVVEMVNGKW
jgi:hypothetical protein